MLASSPTPSRSLSGVSGLGITSGEGVPAERWLTLAFSNKLQFQHRRRRLSEEQSSDHSQQGIGGLGHAVLTAPQVKPRAQNSTSSTKSSNTDQQRHKQQSSKQEDRQPSGADVLLALRWASARKSNKKRKEFPRSSPGKSSPCATDNEEDTTGYSNVRPISIRSDWTTRLDELDKHLQDVIESTLSIRKMKLLAAKFRQRKCCFKVVFNLPFMFDISSCDCCWSCSPQCSGRAKELSVKRKGCWFKQWIILYFACQCEAPLLRIGQ